MKRRSFLATLAAIAMLAVVAIGSPQRAAAQSVPNACCTFTIAYSHLLPAGCLPIAVKTSWGGVTRTDAVTVNGDNFFNFPNCPPAPTTFDWVSIGTGAQASFSGSGTFTLPCGTTVTYDVSRDANGCIRIHIHP